MEQMMLKHFIAIAVAVLLSQAAYSQAKPRSAMYTDYTAIVENKCAIAADGGSMMLTVRNAAGKETVFFINRGFDAKNTPKYNQVRDDKGHKLSDSEKQQLFAHLKTLKTRCSSEDCAEFVDSFVR
ncbi:hypothetical protein HMPREF1051_1992 [Neisseria sicca VK64]|jgi:hypothetical protein|uniref:Uncharacterized protein n=2 Tax=Neisseria sicca TaxID=490 RepID=I2NEB4_NEISI|nr:hypothetical protein HMPREF1051_1992 [Neisseria sicca VK64]